VPCRYLATSGGAWHDRPVPSRGQLLARRALLRTRVRGGDARAALALARSLDREPPRNHAAARRAYGVAAEAGLADGQAALGEMLRDGRGGERDLAGAVRWLAEAARRGSSAAMTALASALLHGDGTRVDPTAAVRLLRRAAAAGQQAAMVELAECLERGVGTLPDPPAALRWLRRAAAQGDPGAARAVGLAYWWGRMGAPRDRSRGASYLLAAARRGDPAAMYRLALARRDGEGVTRSAPAAESWARRAAKAGSARARGLLARLLRSPRRPKRAPGPGAGRGGSGRPCRPPPPRTRGAAIRP
jgi:uncharacterized protein